MEHEEKIEAESSGSKRQRCETTLFQTVLSPCFSTTFEARVLQHNASHPWKELLQQWDVDVFVALQNRTIQWKAEALLPMIRVTDRILQLGYDWGYYRVDADPFGPHQNDGRLEWMSAFLRTVLYIRTLQRDGVLLVRLGPHLDATKETRTRQCDAIRTALRVTQKAKLWDSPGPIVSVQLPCVPVADQDASKRLQSWGADFITRAVKEALTQLQGPAIQSAPEHEAQYTADAQIQTRIQTLLKAWPSSLPAPTESDMAAWEAQVDAGPALRHSDIDMETLDPLRKYFGRRHVWWEHTKFLEALTATDETTVKSSFLPMEMDLLYVVNRTSEKTPQGLQDMYWVSINFAQFAKRVGETQCEDEDQNK